MKKLIYILLLLPFLVKAQSPATLSFTKGATQTNNKDSLGYTYPGNVGGVKYLFSGQFIRQLFGSAGSIKFANQGLSISGDTVQGGGSLYKNLAITVGSHLYNFIGDAGIASTSLGGNNFTTIQPTSLTEQDSIGHNNLLNGGLFSLTGPLDFFNFITDDGYGQRGFAYQGSSSTSHPQLVINFNADSGFSMSQKGFRFRFDSLATKITQVGVTSDGMGPVSVTMDATSPYAYYGMTRAGNFAVAMGMDNLNNFIIGTGPLRNTGATIDTVLFKYNPHLGDLTLGGKLQTTGVKTATGTGTNVFLDDGTLAAYGGGGGSGITALTGDGTASGSGSVAFTLATVNSNTGAFGDGTHVGAFTVNGKGLITAASSTAITFPVTPSNTVTFTNKSGNISQWTNDSGYLTANQSITFTPTGDVTGSASGTTSLTPALSIGAGKVTNTMLAGSIAFSKLIGTDITAVGTLSAGSIPYSLLTGTPSSLPPSGTAGGDLSGTYPNPTVLNSAVIGKVLTGYTSGAGTVSATDNILQAIQKLNGNIAALPTAVTAIGVTTANGVSGTSSGGTTPNLTISLGNITPATVSTTIKPATIYQTAAGTAGTDSIMVKHSGGIVDAISPAFYLQTAATSFGGSAAKLTTARNLAGNSFDGSANTNFANKFIVQGTSDAGLTAAQFLGALGTGIVKNTTSTGVLSIAGGSDLNTTFGTQTANFIYAGPASGSATTPAFRAAVLADMPLFYFNPTQFSGGGTSTSDYLTAISVIHGNSTTTGTATTAVTVTIGSTLANSTYAVSITPRDLLTAVNYYVSAQTTTTFTITFVTALTGSINFDYVINK